MLAFCLLETLVEKELEHILREDTVSVSWCSFSYSDVDEAASMLKPESCTQGKWENMTPTGYFFKDYLNPGKD